MPGPRFSVKPSSILKSPVVRKTRKVRCNLFDSVLKIHKFGLQQLQSGLQLDRLMHLAADKYRAERLRVLHRTTRSRAAAEQTEFQMHKQELDVLMVAAERGCTWTSLDAPLALALSHAARDTLMAEEDTINLKIAECETLLSTLRDSSEAARGRVKDADEQVGSVLQVFKEKGGVQSGGP